ncbi:hypothetical protein GCM10010109_67530 [Actinoplanes campanulatus]|nr:hypothetical protein GCM10010109_67530 [Actinoplanes campanulatus]GID40157.1 hypothetical protein Aca09nite_66630 [Actinoplanes campanulatus]
MEYAGQVRNRIKNGTFTGYCYRDRLLQKGKVSRTGRPEHPAVDWNDTAIVNTGRQRLTKVAVTCPGCGEKRHASPGPIAARVRSGKFTGTCLPCSPNARKREWTVLGLGRKIDPNKGYIRLSHEAIAPEHRELYDAMRGSLTFVTEHRMVVAIALGRPLSSRELVDHMDGVKTNNDLANLRIYRRGRNEPGDTTGYGTFYHEWQMALAEVERLRAQLRVP